MCRRFKVHAFSKKYPINNYQYVGESTESKRAFPDAYTPYVSPIISTRADNPRYQAVFILSPIKCQQPQPPVVLSQLQMVPRGRKIARRSPPHIPPILLNEHRADNQLAGSYNSPVEWSNCHEDF